MGEQLNLEAKLHRPPPSASAMPTLSVLDICTVAAIKFFCFFFEDKRRTVAGSQGFDGLIRPFSIPSPFPDKC